MAAKSILDHGYVTLIEKFGSDEKIVEAARMSTGGGFKGWGLITCKFCKTWSQTGKLLGQCEGGRGGAHSPNLGGVGDEKLLRYMMTNHHETPFEMAGAVFEVKLPIFVVREWHRHRTQSYNEMSGRYIELPNECYVPSLERLSNSKRSTTNKQGSAEGVEPITAEECQDQIRFNYGEARHRYEWMLKQEIAPEIARLVLPVNQYTVMRAGCDLRNWFGFLMLRTAPNAQWEIRQYAEAIAESLAGCFPRSFALFKELRLDKRSSL